MLSWVSSLFLRIIFILFQVIVPSRGSKDDWSSEQQLKLKYWNNFNHSLQIKHLFISQLQTISPLLNIFYLFQPALSIHKPIVCYTSLLPLVSRSFSSCCTNLLHPFPCDVFATLEADVCDHRMVANYLEPTPVSKLNPLLTLDQLSISYDY